MRHTPSQADGWERFARARRGPLAPDAFPSRLHGERTAALLGIALGTAFTICFVTGLMSHLPQRGPRVIADAWPARPVSFYRVTQGIHVLTGMVAVPLLLAKMWVAYPRLWTWPPVRDPFHAIERIALLALVGGAFFQLATGLLNVFYWYLFPFNFPLAHYAGAWIAIGGLIVHVGAKWEAARRGLRRPVPTPGAAAPPPGGLSRRGFLAVVGGLGGTILAVTAGEVVAPLSRLAVLAPRRAGHGPQGVPVNHTAPASVRRDRNVAGLPALDRRRGAAPGDVLARGAASPASDRRTPADLVRRGLEHGGIVAGRARARPARPRGRVH